MPTSPDRTKIQEVINNSAIEFGQTFEERNAIRRAAVEGFLDEDSTFNMDAQGPQGQSIRAMILSDLPTYEGWETEEPVEES